jgi:hypothetical protein
MPSFPQIMDDYLAHFFAVLQAVRGIALTARAAKDGNAFSPSDKLGVLECSVKLLAPLEL